VTETAVGSPAPASSPGRREPLRFVLGKVMGALRGDKYMAGAYPPDRPVSSTPGGRVPRRGDPVTTGADTRSATPSLGR
jgi:hypothetical protein